MTPMMSNETVIRDGVAFRLCSECEGEGGWTRETGSIGMDVPDWEEVECDACMGEGEEECWHDWVAMTAGEGMDSEPWPGHEDEDVDIERCSDCFAERRPGGAIERVNRP